MISQNQFCDINKRKETKIRKRYNQVPHLTQDTTWESNKNTINITINSEELSPFPGSNEHTQKHENHKTQNTNEPQKKYRLGTVS